jgi:heme-degrading monooxygenase HmoA
MKQVLIDKISVPAESKEGFIERMNVNRGIIKRQKGFVRDEVYQQQTGDSHFIFVTVALWQDVPSIKNAREAVEAEYKRTGFDMQEFCRTHRIKLEREIYDDPSEAKNDPSSKTAEQTYQVLIDKVTVPTTEKELFLEKLNDNVEILDAQKGFIKHDTYEGPPENGHVTFVTVVIWQDMESFENARVAVEAVYQRSGFDLRAFCREHNITMERNGIYQPYAN